MTALVKSPRIPDEDPINVNMLKMGFKRAPRTRKRKLPVNTWVLSSGTLNLRIKPNYRGKYVASIFDAHPMNGQVIEHRVSHDAHDTPYSLAVMLMLEGNGDLIHGAQKLRREEK